MPKKETRIILDSNVWLSFLLTPTTSKLDQILQSPSVKLLFSQELLEEFLEVSQRPKFKKYFALVDLQSLLSTIEDKAHFIEVKSTTDICRDVKDNFLLSLAKDGKASFLITGDKDLLVLKTFAKTRIVTIAKFLEEWKHYR